MEDHDWLRAQIDHLTTAQESARPTPWKVSDAPEPFVAAQLKGIVGVEIPIERLEGKWKVSQNRSDADRQSIQEGLRQEDVSEEMAQLVANRGLLVPSADPEAAAVNWRNQDPQNTSGCGQL